MAQDFGTPITPQEPKKNNTTIIVIVVVAVLLLCCCCLILVFGYNYGDTILRELNYSALPTVLAAI